MFHSIVGLYRAQFPSSSKTFKSVILASAPELSAMFINYGTVYVWNMGEATLNLPLEPNDKTESALCTFAIYITHVVVFFARNTVNTGHTHAADDVSVTYCGVIPRLLLSTCKNAKTKIS